ncbi:hypothetical protein RN001_012232 [Aquatica leii]|uniref:MICOS complex subunit MIC10 n=1 Tax=Aquatica leii TaxID=1421715 RepID=A0AAN7Q1E9_9COLE|nr:hypothetical protein RN001_012232 [Aquatica leii]
MDTNVDEAMYKEDQLGRKWDRCITDTIIKFTAGFTIGAVFSGLFLKRKKWPMIIGSGFGIGMAYSNCQRDLNNDEISGNRGQKEAKLNPRMNESRENEVSELKSPSNSTSGEEVFVSVSEDLKTKNGISGTITMEPEPSKSLHETVKTTKTIKTMNANNNSTPIIPSLFKSILFCLSSEENSGKETFRSKEKLPSMCSSQQWKQYYLKKGNIKNKKEKAILDRKRNRQEKKQQKEKYKAKNVRKNNRRLSSIEKVKKYLFRYDDSWKAIKNWNILHCFRQINGCDNDFNKV